MSLRDIVLIVFILNFLFSLIGAWLINFSPISLYLLLTTFYVALLAYWIQEDGEEIQFLKGEIEYLTKQVLDLKETK